MLFCGAEGWDQSHGGGGICGVEGDCGGGWGGRSGASVGQGGVLCDAVGSCGSDPPPQQVLLTLSYPELSWELVGAVGQDGDAAEGLGGTDAAQPPPAVVGV